MRQLSTRVYRIRLQTQIRRERPRQLSRSSTTRLACRCIALADVQQQLQVAVPASTQWDLLNDGADVLRPVFDELVNVAASGNVLHIDDSYVRILEWMGKRREQLVAESKLETPERTGLFTTAVVSILDVGPVALFFNGRQHAGEKRGGRAHPP